MNSQVLHVLKILAAHRLKLLPYTNQCLVYCRCLIVRLDTQSQQVIFLCDKDKNDFSYWMKIWIVWLKFIFIFFSYFLFRKNFIYLLEGKIKTFSISEDGYFESLIPSDLYTEHLLFSIGYNLANVFSLIFCFSNNNVTMANKSGFSFTYLAFTSKKNIVGLHYLLFFDLCRPSMLLVL